MNHEAISAQHLPGHAGVWVFNGALAAPGSATVVRLRDGEVILTDGPFAEAKKAYRAAIARTDNEAERAFLRWKLQRVV